MSEETERHLAELVAYHTGMFTGQVASINANATWIAHALWMLAREADKQRESWLKGQDNGR